MVAVAPHEAFHLPEDFRGIAQPAVFVHDDHAQPVAGVEQFGSHRLVRKAEGVAAHFLELFDLVIVHPVGQRHAEAGEILVVARPLDFEGLAVEEKSPVCVPA